MITKTMARQMNEEMQAFLREFSKKYNLDPRKCTLSYDNAEVNFSIKTRVLDADSGELAFDERANAKARFALLGKKNVPEKIIGAKINIARLGEVTITEYNSRCRVRPFVVKTADGDSYKVPTNMINF